MFETKKIIHLQRDLGNIIKQTTDNNNDRRGFVVTSVWSTMKLIIHIQSEPTHVRTFETAMHLHIYMYKKTMHVKNRACAKETLVLSIFYQISVLRLQSPKSLSID